MELQRALTIANELVESLAPYCEIINIAGSCRRAMPVVKDIEIICLPKKKIIKDLFGDEIKRIRPKEFVNHVATLGEKIKGSALDGKYSQIELKQGVILDLFMPEHFDYYRQFALRTGSAEYSRNVIAAGWRKLGWCGSDAGLRKTSDCLEKKKPGSASTWKCINRNAELPPAWKSEREFFEWLNVEWVEPKLRRG